MSSQIYEERFKVYCIWFRAYNTFTTAHWNPTETWRVEVVLLMAGGCWRYLNTLIVCFVQSCKWSYVSILELVCRVKLVSCHRSNKFSRNFARKHDLTCKSRSNLSIRKFLQISSYGLHAFKRGEETEDDGEYKHYMKLLWTAPEILRLTVKPRNGTQKGDVYSYGIILQEVIYRALPFFMDEMSPKGNLPV